MSARRRISARIEGRRAEAIGRRAVDIVTEPGKPRAHELAGLQLIRQAMLADVAKETRQPRDWPLGQPKPRRWGR